MLVIVSECPVALLGLGDSIIDSFGYDQISYHCLVVVKWANWVDRGYLFNLAQIAKREIGPVHIRLSSRSVSIEFSSVVLSVYISVSWHSFKLPFVFVRDCCWAPPKEMVGIKHYRKMIQATKLYCCSLQSMISLKISVDLQSRHNCKIDVFSDVLQLGEATPCHSWAVFHIQQLD